MNTKYNFMVVNNGNSKDNCLNGAGVQHRGW